MLSVKFKMFRKGMLLSSVIFMLPLVYLLLNLFDEWVKKYLTSLYKKKNITYNSLFYSDQY